MFDDLSAGQNSSIVILSVITCGWFFAIGACIGSFLNVVIYRLPRGRQVLSGSSHCPSCGETILARDNIPILSWLWLRGRCRVCGWRIPFRYPAVEILIGALFLALLLAEVVSGGKNLPNRIPNAYSGVVWVIWSAKWDLMAVFAFHALLLCHLWPMALIEGGGQRVPLRLPAFGLLSGAIFSALAPGLHFVPFAPRSSNLLSQTPWVNELLDFGAGVLGGLVAAAPLILTLAARRRSDVRPPATPFGLMAAMAMVGGYLGWQAAFAVAAETAALALVWSLLTRVRRGFGAWPLLSLLAIAALAQIVFWRSIEQWRQRDLMVSGPIALAACWGFAAVASGIAGWIWRRPPWEPALEPQPDAETETAAETPLESALDSNSEATNDPQTDPDPSAAEEGDPISRNEGGRASPNPLEDRDMRDG